MFGRKHQETVRYQMRQKMFSIGDDFWIEDDGGDKVFKVNGKALRVRETLAFEDRDGNELLKIQSKMITLRDKMKIERGGETVATLHKKLIGFRDRYTIDLEAGGELHAKGNFVDHEYEISRDGDTVATVSKKWLRVRDTYGIEVNTDEEQALILAIAACIDMISHEGR